MKKQNLNPPVSLMTPCVVLYTPIDVECAFSNKFASFLLVQVAFILASALA
jgi:hypothetical protein